MSLLALALATALAAGPDRPGAASAAPYASAAERPDECLVRDEEGRQITACFDPGNRLAFWGAGAVGLQPGELQGGAAFGVGLRLRRSRASRSDPKATWFSEHRILELQVSGPLGGRFWPPTLSGWGYQGLFQRHLDEGFILLPTARPVRLPFPFDIAIAPQAVGFERSHTHEVFDHLELLRTALLLDAAKDVTGLSRFAFGPALAYLIIRQPGGQLVHVLQPLTGLQVRVRKESHDGLWAAQAQLDAGWAIVPGKGGGVWAQGDLEVERIVFAVNDLPWSVRVAIKGVERRAGEKVETLSGTLGLVAAFE
jgi:hypothetical protein